MSGSPQGDNSQSLTTQEQLSLILEPFVSSELGLNEEASEEEQLTSNDDDTTTNEGETESVESDEAEQPEEAAEEAEATDEGETIELDLDTLIMIKKDGVEKPVPLRELAIKYNGETKIEQRLAELGEERRKLEAERLTIKEQAEAEAEARYAAKLESTTQFIAEIDPVIAYARSLGEAGMLKLAQSNPAEYTKLKAQVDQHIRYYETSVAELNAINERRAKQQEEANTKAEAERVAQEREKLFEAIPEWRNEETLKNDVKRLAEFGEKTYGFTKQELASITDHRVLRALIDAERGARMRSGEATAPKEKVKVVKKVLKPTTSTRSGAVRTPTSSIVNSNNLSSREKMEALLRQADV